MEHRPKHRTQPRRTRTIVLTLAVLLLISSPLWARCLGRPGPPVATVHVVVQPGDTLWTLARQHGPRGADPRRVVSRMERANGLEGALIHPGQVLLVPKE